MLKGRLGLETARIPHADRHGLIWLARGNLSVTDGTLRFVTAGTPDMAAGDYAIPFQGISLILLGPGSTVSHDVLRSEEHTSELQSLMRISYAVFCLKKKNKQTNTRI